MIILKIYFKETGSEFVALFIWQRTGTSGSYFEHGNEVSGSVKTGNYFSNCTSIIFSSKTLLHTTSSTLLRGAMPQVSCNGQSDTDFFLPFQIKLPSQSSYKLSSCKLVRTTSPPHPSTTNEKICRDGRDASSICHAMKHHYHRITSFSV